MNNNNLYNNNTFIGITHNDYFKTASNALSNQIVITSNILEGHLSNTSNILINNIYNTSNILDSKASNFTTTTSNLILARYDPLIREEIEHITLPIPLDFKHTYIYNSNILGEIRFWTKSTKDFIVVDPINVPDYRVKIDVDGKLKVYYTFDPAINLTFMNGWVDVANSIVALNASDANIGISLGGLEGQIIFNLNYLEGKIQALVSSLLGHNVLDKDTYDDVVESLELYRTNEFTDANSIPDLFTNIKNLFRTGRLNYLTEISTILTYRISQNPITSAFLGIGGVAVGFAVSYIQNQGYLNTITARIDELIGSNINITSGRRSELLASNLENQVDTYIELCSNMYNFNLIQGFINCNIQTQQYIRDLRCDSLNLNTGNISGINYINVNNIIADGRIKENNKFLDTTYLTSNHIYNLSNIYSSERQYPSKLFSISQPEGTGTILNKLVYKQIIYLDNNNITYGSGFYEIYSSSTYDIPTTKNKLFNFDTVETTNTPRWGISLYDSGTGNYSGDNSIDNLYFGDWVILKMPQPILLTRYRIYQNTQFPNRAPSEWKVYGSNDGITFTQITEAHQLTRLTSYSSGYYEKSLATTFITSYQYLGFVFNKLLSTSGETTLNFVELQIFGKEILSNSIVSNIYTTSNAVKGIVEFEMPIVCKHKAFYCQTSTIIYPNNGNTAYYKYDIDMRNYTQTGYIQIGSQSNDPYRIFRIRAFLGSCYFSSLVNGLPDILHYEIYMSYKAQAASGGQGAAGVNIYAVGVPNNPTLNIVPPNNIFILTNPFNDFNYITLVSTSPADIRVIIEDLIS